MELCPAEGKFRALSRKSFSAGQHFFVDDEKVAAVAIGKQSGGERKAVDFTLNFYLAALAPKICGVKRKPRNHPAQAVGRALQHCCKGLFCLQGVFGADLDAGISDSLARLPSPC